MLFKSSNPFTGRNRFRDRILWVVVENIFLFTICICVSSYLTTLLRPGSWVALYIGSVIWIVIFYFIYRYSVRQPLKIACPKCGKIISSISPWVCGVCKKPNLNTIEFPFVNKCGNPDCGVEPKAYKCHHINVVGEDRTPCGEIIFLTEDKDATNYAYCLNSPAEMTKSDLHAEEIQGMRESKVKIEMQREIALVKEDLAIIRERIRSQKPEKRSAKEMLQANVEQVEELQVAGDELKAFYAQKYKGKKAVRDRLITAVDAEILRQGIERK